MTMPNHCPEPNRTDALERFVPAGAVQPTTVVEPSRAAATGGVEQSPPPVDAHCPRVVGAPHASPAGRMAAWMAIVPLLTTQLAGTFPAKSAATQPWPSVLNASIAAGLPQAPPAGRVAA
jgi:hypothetical protein